MPKIMILGKHNCFLAAIYFLISGLCHAEKDDNFLTCEIVGNVENITRIKVSDKITITKLLSQAKIVEPWGSKSKIYIISIFRKSSNETIKEDGKNNNIKIYNYSIKTKLKDLNLKGDKILIYVPARKFTGK